MKPSVLHIIDTLGVGGAEQLMTGAVMHLPDFNHHVVYLKDPDGPRARLPIGCRVKKLNYRGKRDIFCCALQLREYLKKYNIRIVHSHLYMATVIARIGCPKDVRLFSTIHSLGSRNYFERSFPRLLEKMTYRSRHHLIAICNEVLDDYSRCIGLRGPYTILYNYVEDEFFSGEYKRFNRENGLRLIAVGNLKAAKNYSYLVEAFRRLPQNVHLDVYGSGEMEHELKQLIREYAVKIRLCGVREDIHKVLKQYDAFIMSSQYEGQPLALLQAMASGIPAILSDIPVLREATNNHAVFYDLSDPTDLVRKIHSILRGEINLDLFAEAGMKRAKKIADKENYMHRLRNLYLHAEMPQLTAAAGGPGLGTENKKSSKSSDNPHQSFQWLRPVPE
ncbi:MAG TPA: glycosyltransferase [Chitinophagaceae bacterium]|nr:glycosyltransferase [Chitinophagaceae bacterium]